MQSQILIWCIKLVLGGIAAFLAIMVWSKSRSACWVFLVTGILISYAGIIYDMMINLGILNAGNFLVYGIPFLTLVFTVIPYLLIIISLILIIKDLS
ncbi:MAG: hypothetical protein IJM22_02315 [Treponema sp.]|uniref:hypothetical protein n=1 Tax=Treponema sp. TaxID=166 RepID=UPI0038901CC4|nr:hypothetical protein [Treponema sp.]